MGIRDEPSLQGVTHVKIQTQTQTTMNPTRSTRRCKRSRRPRIRGGTAFDPDELEAAVAARPKGLKKKNGAAVVDSRQREIALKHLSALSRALYELGLFDEFNASLSQMIRRVKTLR